MRRSSQSVSQSVPVLCVRTHELGMDAVYLCTIANGENRLNKAALKAALTMTEELRLDGNTLSTH